MNRSHTWKFMLSIVTLWLPVALANANTTCPSAPTCNISCTSSQQSTCTVYVTQSGGATTMQDSNGNPVTTICVASPTLGNAISTIEWKAGANSVQSGTFDLSFNSSTACASGEGPWSNVSSATCNVPAALTVNSCDTFTVTYKLNGTTYTAEDPPGQDNLQWLLWGQTAEERQEIAEIRTPGAPSFPISWERVGDETVRPILVNLRPG